MKLRRLLCTLCTAALLISVLPAAFGMGGQIVPVTQSHHDIILDGKINVRFQVSDTLCRSPLLWENRVYIPLMTAGQWLGADAAYDGKTAALTSNGSAPVYYNWRDMVDKGTPWDDWEGLEKGALLRKDVTVTLDGKAQSFTDAAGQSLFPLEFQEALFLPLEGVTKLCGKEMTSSSIGYLQLIHLYDTPTQEQLEEAGTYLSVVRGHLDAARTLIKGDTPQNEEERITKMEEIQRHVKAVYDLPAPTFSAMAYYVDDLRESALLTLWGNVDGYLPQPDSSGAARILNEEIGLPVSPSQPLSILNRGFEGKWADFTDFIIPNQPGYSTYFSGLEGACSTGEAFLAKVGGQPAPEAKPEPQLEIPPFTVPTAEAADASKFSDADQIDHVEAVAALARLGAIQGKEDGAFHPKDTLTRAEAAKLVTTIMCGGKETVLEGWYEAGFTDIQGHWASPYIEFCADMVILSGRGDGSFGPDEPLTPLELCKMALAALGYDPDAYRLTGKAWAVRTDELARQSSPSLYTGLEAVNTAEPCTRDSAAQILYNALRCTPKCVKPVPTPEGKMTWEFADSTKTDGTPSTLLYERFGLDEIPDLPAWPEK